MIEVSELSKSFGEVQAISQISFKVPKGSIVGFLGANGAGKSTTMDILCGYLGADQGSAKVAGYDIAEQPIEAKKRLGYLPDVPPLHLDMYVTDYIEYCGVLKGLSKVDLRSKVDATISKLALWDVRNRIIGNLSKGYRQRVGLAQALVHDPDVLILDEPTEGLDPTQINEMRNLIRGLAGQHTVLLSSHILSEVQNTADSLVVINKGKVVAQGTYESLSTAMEGGGSYRLRVAQNAIDAVASLENVHGIRDIKASSNEEIEFSFVDPSIKTLDPVARCILDGGFGLVELSQKSKSLEEVFLKLTKKS
jgi:ABC-2 type transport system ATP-binding protein